MRVILSRKGFDSSYGGMPSPILPDGTLLSLPIPSKDETIKFTDLRHGSQSYFEIIKQLKPSTKIKEYHTCHLDPDINEAVLNRTVPWYPLFGQHKQSQQHLAQQGIGFGDLFLFWGWFRQTEINQGVLRYAKNAPDIHLIWGFLKVTKVISGLNIPPRYHYHPHSKWQTPDNCIYEGSRDTSGKFMYNEKLVLTKKSMSRSKWEFPEYFKKVSITYHSKESFKEGYFQSAMRGQEFVIEENTNIEDWGNKIICECRLV